MNVKKLKKNKKGFTLVEIIVVLVIIGILMALAVPAVMKYIDEAAETKVQSQVRAGYVAAQSYAASEVGKTPGISETDLATKVSDAGNINIELGLIDKVDDKAPAGAVNSIRCTVTKQKVDSCEITIIGADGTYTASRTDIVKNTK